MSLVRRRPATWENILVAAPANLAEHGTPRSAADLAGHAFVTLPRWHHAADVLAGPSGQRHRVDATSRIVCNNQISIRRFTLAGCGLSFGVVPEMWKLFKTRRRFGCFPSGRRHRSAPMP